jgi:hypothetical protein
MRFKLLAGQHIQADETQERDELTGKYPSKTFTAPAIVESDTDLVKKHGREKFERLPDRMSRRRATAAVRADETPNVRSSPGTRPLPLKQSEIDEEKAAVAEQVSVPPDEDDEEEEDDGPGILQSEEEDFDQTISTEMEDDESEVQDSEQVSEQAKAEEEETTDPYVQKLERMTLPELKVLATRKKIRIHNRTTKTELVEALSNAR